MENESIFTIAFTLFFTLNPIGNLPVFIALLKDFEPKRQVWIIFREMIVALILMIMFGFFGKVILTAIGINHNIINIGGGVILFLIALNMIFPKHPTPESSPRKKEPFIVPLATPIVAGGGTLAAVMMFGFRSNQPFVLFTGILSAWFVNSIILLLSPIAKIYVKESVLEALERLMGLVLTLIASQMIVGGILSFVTSQLSELEKPLGTSTKDTYQQLVQEAEILKGG